MLGPLFKMRSSVKIQTTVLSPGLISLLLSIESFNVVSGDQEGLKQGGESEGEGLASWVVDVEAAVGFWQASGQTSRLGDLFPPYKTSVIQCWKERRCEL